MKYKKWIEKQELENRIICAKERQIIVFAADWCGYCSRFIQFIGEYNVSNDSQSLEIGIVDADSEDGSIWDKFKIDVVPTICVFDNGVEVFRRSGRAGIGLRQIDLEDAINASLAKSMSSSRN